MASKSLGKFGALWGLSGVFLLIGSAVFRLGSRALSTPFASLTWIQWSALVAIVVFMGYAEGYRGFQTKFSPRVAARARYLIEHPRVWLTVFAPFFCMGYFHATRRRQIASISLTAGIVAMVFLVRLAPTPWREIIDFGVVLGLIWGLISLAIFTYQGLFHAEFPYSPEVPEGAGQD